MTRFRKADFFAYLTSNQLDDWGAQMPTMGYHHAAPRTKYPPSGHPKTHAFEWKKGRVLTDCHIVYIPTGAGRFQTRHDTMRISAGDLILIYENDWHRYKPDDDKGWEEYWVGFKGSYIDKYVVGKLFPDRKSYQKSIGYQQDLVTLFSQLVEISKTDSPLFKMVSLGCLLQIIAYCTVPLEVKEARHRSSFLLDSVIAHIRENLFSDVDFRELAESSSLSYSRFRALFKKGAGMAPNQFLINERIECAKRLLRNPGMDIKTIAYKAGFQSSAYFSRVFQRKTGMSPSDERARRL